MPNAPKTPTRTLRVSTELWNAAKAKAEREGVTLTSVIIKRLKEYVAESN